jgi:acetyl-CoA carboxylase biotin carboxyl carrier protein
MKQKKSPRSSASPSLANPEIEQIEQLLRLMAEHNLEEFEYSSGDLRIRLRKPSAGYAVSGPRQMAPPEIIVHSAAEPAARGSSESQAAAVLEGRSTEDLHIIKSPIVGTYYGSPSPGADPFVKVGAHVESGQTLCIVEAMKLMNEIESDETGEIIRIFVENGQPVEYGQPLFGIRPSRKK